MESSGSKEAVLQVLGAVPVFSGLKIQILHELHSLFKEKLFKKDDFIIKEGSKGSSMMIIISGSARVSQVTGASEEEALVILKEGEYFGEMAMLEELPRSATVIADTDVIILKISRGNFLKFVQNNPESGNVILLNIAKTLSARLRETDNKLKAFVNFSQWV